MPYTPQTWEDSPSTATPLSAARLGVMEAGIAAAITGDKPRADINFLNGFTSRGAGNTLITVKPSTDTSEGLINWLHDSPSGYLFHLEMGSNAAHPAAALGIGTSGTGTGNGLLVAHKNNGNGILLDNQATAAGGGGKAGFYGQQQNTTLSLMKLIQVVAASAPALEVGADGTATASQKLQVWNTNVGEAGNVNASTGKLTWSKDVALTGSDVRVGAGTTGVGAALIVNGGAATARDLVFQSAGFGRWTLRGADATGETGSDAGSDFVIFSRTDGGGFKETVLNINRRAGWANFPKGITTRTKAGAPVDGDWAVAPPNGTLHVDETNSRLYVRVGGAWKSALLA